MKKKIGIVVILFVILFLMLAGYGSDSTEEGGDSNASNEPGSQNTTSISNPTVIRNVYYLGESVNFQSGLSIKIIDSRYLYSNMYNRTVTYFDFEIVNNGSESRTVSSGLFSTYADNCAVDFVYESDSFYTASLDPGRMIQGRVYVDMDPTMVNNIEVQVGDVIWVIKGWSSIAEIRVNGVKIEIPQEMNFSATPLNNTGIFSDDNLESTIEMILYDEPKGNIVGEVKITDTREILEYEGVLVEIYPNVYYLVYEGYEQVLISFCEYNMNDYYYVEGQLFVDGSLMDFYFENEEQERPQRRKILQ